MDLFFYFSPYGSVSQKQFGLCYLVVSLGLCFIADFTFAYAYERESTWLSLAASAMTVLAVYLFFAGAAKRFRDIGKPAWNVVFLLIPIVQLVMLYSLLRTPTTSTEHTIFSGLTKDEMREMARNSKK